MNTRILEKVLGATAALALLVPVAVSPALAQTWYAGPPDYGYGAYGYGYASPGLRANDPSGFPAQNFPDQYGNEQGYGPGETYGPDQAYGANEGYGPSESYGPGETYGPDQTYGTDEGYGPNGSYGPDQAYGVSEGYGPNEPYGLPSDRSVYRSPEVPPARQGYVGAGITPQDYRSGYPETGHPHTGWVYPQAQAGDHQSDRSERLVSAVDLNMHAGPSNEAPVRTVLPAGTPVHVTASTDSGWVQVDSPFGRGWVYSRYLAPA